MFLPYDHERRGEGEPPKKPEPNRHSKGWPEKRDPAAEAPRGVLSADLNAAARRKLEQRYAPARICSPSSP